MHRLIVIIVLLVSHHASFNEDCSVCLQDETPNLWFFACSQSEDGCVTECIYLIKSNVSEYVEQSLVSPILFHDERRCSDRGVCSNGTCTDIRGDVEVSLNALNFKWTSTLPENEVEVSVEVRINHQTAKTKRMKEKGPLVPVFFHDELSFTNVSITDEFRFFIKSQEFNHYFPIVVGNFTINILTIKQENSLNKFKVYYFLSDSSYVQVAIN